MNVTELETLARQLLEGTLALDEFLAAARAPATADLAEAQIDLDRARRCGYPEVVFGQGKTVVTLEKIFTRLVSDNIDVFATRVSAEQAAVVCPKFPRGRYNSVARTFRIPLDQHQNADHEPAGHVAVVTA